MTTAMQIGEAARDSADFCRCFKTGAAVFLHDDGIVAHSTYRNTPSEPCAPARTNCDTRGCAPVSGRQSALGVRRVKAALSSGCKSHPATAPAGSNRSSHGGDEMAEAFGYPRLQLTRGYPDART